MARTRYALDGIAALGLRSLEIGREVYREVLQAGAVLNEE